MNRFNEVSYDKTKGVVKYGSGLVWDDVYRGLEQYDVKVTGGRVSDVGVAGFSLGGGYSFLTNQYGLTSDGIVAYDFVTATGKILHVTRCKYPDLFFLLQGGFNNAGVVTNFYAKTRPRAKIWGGLAYIDANKVSTTCRFLGGDWRPADGSISFLPVLTVLHLYRLTKYSTLRRNSHRSKTQICLAAYSPHSTRLQECPSSRSKSSTTTQGESFSFGLCNIATRESAADRALSCSGPANGSFVANIFEQLLALGLQTDVAPNRYMADFVKLAPSEAVAGLRGTFSSVSLERLTPEILQTIKEEFKVSHQALLRLLSRDADT